MADSTIFYLPSNYIKIFPCANRGAANIEAKLSTEYNIRNIPGKLASNYLVEKNTSTSGYKIIISLVLASYFIEIKIPSTAGDIANPFLEGYANDLFCGIRLADKPLTADAQKTQVLACVDTGDTTILDVNDYFKGIAFWTNSNDAPSGDDIITFTLRTRSGSSSAATWISDKAIDPNTIPIATNETYGVIKLNTDDIISNDFSDVGSLNTQTYQIQIQSKNGSDPVLGVKIPYSEADTTTSSAGLGILMGKYNTNHSKFSFIPYTGRIAGKFYSGTANPTSSTRLNYDGQFYATEVYAEGARTVVDWELAAAEARITVLESSPMLPSDNITLGAMFYCSNVDDKTISKLDIGNTNYIMASSGTAPKWINLVSGNGITINKSSSQFTITTKAKTNGGVSNTSDGLAVQIKTDGGLVCDDNGIWVKLAEGGGIVFDSTATDPSKRGLKLDIQEAAGHSF